MYEERQGPSYTTIHAIPVCVQPPRSAHACRGRITGCSLFMISFAIFLTITGALMTVTSYRKNVILNPSRTVGPVLLAIGLLIMVPSIAVCCIMMSKQQRQQRQVLQCYSQVPTQTFTQPLSGYPQQLQVSYTQSSGVYQQNTQTSSYSSQQSSSMSQYPSQQAVPDFYPTQLYSPTNYPTQQNVPTSSYPYQQNVPPSSYSTQQNGIPPPSYDESIHDTQSNIPSKITLNGSSENDTSTHGTVIPSVPTLNVSGAHRYQESQWKS